MLKRLLIAALGVLACTGASTIDPTLPANGVPYSASVIRGQFQNAANDINALQSMNAGTTQPFSCTLANEGAVWLNNTSSPFVLNICDGNGSWVPHLYLDTTNHIATPTTGRGAQQTITAATTTDLGSVPQSSILVSGSSVSITSLGSSAKAGDIKIVQFNGANTLVYNAVSLILPGATNQTTANGTVWVFESLGNGNWLGVISSGATAISTTAAPGTSTNTTGSLDSAAASVTITASGIATATSLTGTTYVLGNFNQTFNSATTGAGGMDIGALPSSGYVCIYAIYNPSTLTASILGTNCSTSNSTIYGGANAPSGYTASALIAAWPTNSTPNMVAGYVKGRNFYYQTGATILAGSTTAQSSITSLSMSGAVPPNARTYDAVISILTDGSQAAGSSQSFLYPASTGTISNPGQRGASWYLTNTAVQTWLSVISNIPITVAQTTYYSSGGLTSHIALSIGVSSYSW